MMLWLYDHPEVNGLFNSGTGKLKGIKGQGTFKTTYADDGSYTVLVTGDYELPATK